MRPAGWGTNHVGWGNCKLHIGCTRNGIRKAQNLMAIAATETYGLPIQTTAHEALEHELYRTAGHVAWLQMKIAEADESDLTERVGGGGGGLPGIEPSVWLKLYAQERDHLTKIAKVCHDVGIDERRTLIAEQQGQLLAQAVQGILLEFGLANDPRAPQIVRKYLYQAAGSATGFIEGTATAADSVVG
jgi:hypothetical protein